MLSYEILRVIWWLLLGTLLIGFAIMDGFDLGAAMLLPFVARTDKERRIVLNSIGPVWDGNQAWLILAAGAIFAAWPNLYAVAFSGFYLAMFLALAALILRPVSFKFRSDFDHPIWRTFWDYALFISGVVPSLIFGVAVGNALRGGAVPLRLRFAYDLRGGSLRPSQSFRAALRSCELCDACHAWRHLFGAEGRPAGRRSRRELGAGRRSYFGRSVHRRRDLREVRSRGLPDHERSFA
jgi:cytochrome bd-type quinol oxidase subunit 2